MVMRRQLRVRDICWGWGSSVIIRRAGNISFPFGRLRSKMGNKMVPVGTVEGVERPR